MMATAYINDPGKIVYTLKLTMPLAEWKQIRKTLNLNATYSELKVIREIDDLVGQLETTLFCKEDES